MVTSDCLEFDKQKTPSNKAETDVCNSCINWTYDKSQWGLLVWFYFQFNTDVFDVDLPQTQ